MDPLIEHNPGLYLVGERVLHLAEHVVCTGEGKGKQSGLPEIIVPLLHNGSLLGDRELLGRDRLPAKLTIRGIDCV